MERIEKEDARRVVSAFPSQLQTSPSGSVISSHPSSSGTSFFTLIALLCALALPALPLCGPFFFPTLVSGAGSSFGTRTIAFMPMPDWRRL
jgi:hypothetical protein